MSWLVIGLKDVMTVQPRSNFKTFLHKNAGKILVFALQVFIILFETKAY